MNLNYLGQLSLYIPELLTVTLVLCLLLVETTYNTGDKDKKIFHFISFVGLVLVLVSLCNNFELRPSFAFTRGVVIDKFGSAIKFLMVLGTLFVFHFNYHSKDIYEEHKSEFVILSLCVLIGGMLLSSAVNLLTFYLGVEMLSIPSYVLASLKKYNSKSNEAGLKYTLYGGVAAAVMLFGMGHLYGVAGSLDFMVLSKKLGYLSSGEMVIIVPSMLLIFIGMAFKLSLVPFHMWTPDVYEGSPTPVTTFFALVPKMSAFALLVRWSTMLFETKLGATTSLWMDLLCISAFLTLIVGNIAAIGQKSVKRMLAYSSVAHAGFMILGVIVLNKTGVSSITFYMLAYIFMTIVPFMITGLIADHYGNDSFDRFNGLMHNYPLVGGLMAISMFSLAGIPPLSGFVAKFNILYAVIEKKYYFLALVGVLTSVISLYYYLRIVRLMVFRSPESNEDIKGLNLLNKAFLLVMTVPTITLGVFWNRISVFFNTVDLFIK